MSINANYSRSFGMRDKFGYAFGDLANCLTFTLCSMFFLKFYQEVVGINPAIIGAFMMGCKFFDAFTDVFMGEICDRSKPTKKGRFAPWMLRFSGPVCLAAFLMFAPWVVNWSMPAKIFWMAFTYIFYGSICYTGVNIPYGSMASAVSSSPKDRTELSNFRAIGSTIGGTTIGVVLPMLAFDKISETKTVLNGTKVMWITVVLGVVAFALYLLCYYMTTERVKIKNKVEKFSMKTVFKTWVTSKAVLVVIIATIVCITATTYIDTMKTYVFVNVFNNKYAQSVSTFTNFFITLGLSAVMLPLTIKFGRKSLCVFGSFLFAGFYFLTCALTYNHVNVWAYYGLHSAAFVGNAIFNLVCWAMVGDIIDDAEIKNKRREDGSIYGAYSFSRKMGQAIASGISGLILSLVGVKGSDVVYTPALKSRLFTAATLVPAILFLATGLIFFFFYPLNKLRVNANAAFLKECHEKGMKTYDTNTVSEKNKQLNYVIVKNKTLDEYKKFLGDDAYKYMNFTTKELNDFDMKYNSNYKHYLLKDRHWWLINGTYYEVPKH